MAPRFQERYRTEIAPALMKEFGYRNVMQVPRLKKIVVNIGLGEAKENDKAIDSARGDLAAITGQHAVITRAKRAIANFKIRAGMPIGMVVTLRGDRMYYFYDRLVSATLSRLRDFNGVSPRGFDGRGNYSLGLREQTVFPEIDIQKVEKIRGLEVTIVTTARSDEEGRRLLQLMGMPFAR
ncbi:MAG: 50S ribosomal protein L5 [Chloroflexi bacterium]|nr:50S ribosomal protein L5 [Chloroflexota bacterium]